MSFPYLGETKDLNDDARKSARGSFIQLADGITHYELSNPEKENTIILVHGFSVPYFIYDPTFEFLTESGFRVLRYDLFGRGFSDRPDSRYNIDLFVKQLGNLLDELRSTRPVNLVGLSTGGPITAAFTARFPRQVNKLVLIDPVGAKPIDSTLTLKVAKIPIVGEIILGRFGSASMVKNAASDLFDPALAEDFQSQYKVQMQYKGFMRAILLTRAAMPNLELHVIENCGHIPHYEKPAEVNTILLDFLRK